MWAHNEFSVAFPVGLVGASAPSSEQDTEQKETWVL